MAKTKAAHHRGSYQVQARRVVQAAEANPSTICWRCKRTITEVRQAKPRARWTAGHLIDGQIGGLLAAECSPCNYGHGAASGNRRRKPKPWTSRAW